MFRIGQKVVCVNSEGAPTLKKNEIYTVLAEHPYRRDAILLKEAMASIGNLGFYNWRFRPLDESFADEVLKNIAEQIEEENLVTI